MGELLRIICLCMHKELPLSPCWLRLVGKAPERGG